MWEHIQAYLVLFLDWMNLDFGILICLVKAFSEKELNVDCGGG
jgi:hypothetical protein